MKNFIFYLLFFLSQYTQAQELYGLHAVWDDSFSHWVIETDDEDVEGELYLRWPERGLWTEWDYDLGIRSGVIKQKWIDNPNIWVLRGDGETVDIRTTWRGDFSQWKFDDGTTQVTLKSRYTSSYDEWYIRESETFKMYTIYDRDPRNWEIYEPTDVDLSFEMRLAIAFIASYHASPKR